MRRKNSIRLRGFDYAQDGAYFITICTKHRKCIFGEVIDAEMRLSPIGKIVEACWKEMPQHFPGTKVSVYQIMPNHVHGIVCVKGDMHVQRKDLSRRGLQLKTPTQKHLSNVSPRSGTLGVIVRTFKGAVTTELRKSEQYKNAFLWQRNYHDHILRDDIDYFFVLRYIELNPLLWELDSDNPNVHQLAIGELRAILRKRYNLEGEVLERIIEHETDYRERSQVV